MQGEPDQSPPFSDEELDKVIGKLKKGKRPGIDEFPTEVFIYAGAGVRKALLDLLNQVKSTREIPDQWNLMEIITIYKQKGCKKMLRYYRGIFLAITISKIFESLIKERIDPNLAKVNILQAGSRKNRGGPDNVFLLRGCVDHYVACKQPLYITAYDYEQAFDSLWVEKCILALKNLDVSKEMLQIIYNLNKKANVVVKTPYGLTEPFETDPVVKQGTVLGSALCSSSTAEYCGINKGVLVGNMFLSSLLYVDDVIDLASSLIDREEFHREALIFAKMNNLTLSDTKCYGMALNTDVNPPELMIEVDGSKFVIPVEVLVYLGDVFNTKGNNDDLIKDRVRRGTKASICITSLIQETNLGKHEISVWLLLYHSLFLSTVLFNSQTWSRLRDKDMEKLQVMQQKLLKKMVGVSTGTPNSFLFLELGVLPIKAELHKRQLMYLHRILLLPIDDPVHQMFINLMALDLKGEENWWTQVKLLLPRYGLPLVFDNLRMYTKSTFKSLVNKAIRNVVTKELISECTSLQKTCSLQYETLETQEYLKVLYPNQARIILKSRCETLNLKTQNTFKFREDDTVCRKCCVEEETLQHVINCGFPESEHINFNASHIDKLSDLQTTILMRITNRVEAFYDLVS